MGRGRGFEKRACEWGKKGVKMHHLHIPTLYNECSCYIYLICINKVKKKNEMRQLDGALFVTRYDVGARVCPLSLAV